MKGYDRTIELLSIRGNEKAQARALVVALSDRRALWESFDAEFPDRVRHSLDELRNRLLHIRDTTDPDGPMDDALAKLVDTIIVFFRRMEKTDLATLCCDSRDPEWRRFCDALATLRKSLGYQLHRIAEAYNIDVSGDLKSLLPVR